MSNSPSLAACCVQKFNNLTRHLEDVFYRSALANFSVEIFVAAGFTDQLYKDFQTVAKDEATHVKFLTDAITAAGAAPVAECIYNFPVVDVKTFVALASVLEGMLPELLLYNPIYLLLRCGTKSKVSELTKLQALVLLHILALPPAFKTPTSSLSPPLL